jgi:5-methylcytosine-specific restriction endonuclease McrA
MELHKVCSKCSQSKPHSEFRKSQKGDRHGLHSWCYDCNRKARREHYQKNKQKYRDWYLQWCENNQDKVKAYEENRDRDYAESYRRQMSLPHGREQKRAYDHNYRARKVAAEGILTKEVVQKVFETYGVICLACGSTSDIQIDHVTPLSLGGTNMFENLQPLCKSCNSSKGNRSTADYRTRAVAV